MINPIDMVVNFITGITKFAEDNHILIGIGGGLLVLVGFFLIIRSILMGG